MKKTVFIALLMLLVLSGSWFAGQWLQKKGVPGKAVATYFSSCNVLKSECEFMQSGHYYTIKFIGKPSPLSPFIVQLGGVPLSMDTAEISFKMQNMDMGYAVYSLSDAPQSTIRQTKVILPVCSAGRNDWKLNVKLTSEGEVAITEFRFFSE